MVDRVRQRLRSPQVLGLLLRVVGAIPVVAILFYAADTLRFLEERFVRIFAQHGTIRESPVAVVEIDDNDLKHLFGGKRPLAPQKLGEVIEAVVDLGAKAIAVDVFTSDPVFGELASRSWRVPIVWGRSAEWSRKGNIFYPEPVLGGVSRPAMDCARV